MESGVECFRVEFPKGMDANAYALKVTPAAKRSCSVAEPGGVAGKGAACFDSGAGDRCRSKRKRAAKEETRMKSRSEGLRSNRPLNLFFP